MNARRLVALAEVTIVFAAFFWVNHWLSGSAFNTWQIEHLGHPSMTSILAFFVLPLPFMAGLVRSGAHDGMSTARLGGQLGIALRAMAFIGPLGMLFPVLAWIGTTHRDPLGALILSAGAAGGGFLFAWTSRGLPSRRETAPSLRGLGLCAVLLAAGLATASLGHAFLPVAGRVIRVILFVALLEEVFFRGYIQSRVNASFGRPHSAFGVSFGAGLVLSALLFGLAHPLSAPGDPPWTWGLWTAVGGLVLAFVRDKTDGVAAPAALHAVMILPTAFVPSQ